MVSTVSNDDEVCAQYLLFITLTFFDILQGHKKETVDICHCKKKCIPKIS